MLVYVMYVYFMESNPCTCFISLTVYEIVHRCVWGFVHWYWYCFDFSPFRFSSFTKLMAYSYGFIPIFFQPSFLWFILLSLFIQCPLFHLHTCYTFHPFLYLPLLFSSIFHFLFLFNLLPFCQFVYISFIDNFPLHLSFYTCFKVQRSPLVLYPVLMQFYLHY